MATVTINYARFIKNVAATVEAEFPGVTTSIDDDPRDGWIIRCQHPGGRLASVISPASAYEQYRAGQRMQEAIDDLLAGIREMLAVESDRGRIVDWERASKALMVQLSRRRDDGDQEPQNRRVGLPWQGDLVLSPVLDNRESLTTVTQGYLDRWGKTLDEVIAIGTARTRDALDKSLPSRTFVLDGALVLVWDNDLPGYTATRAAWSELCLGLGEGTATIPEHGYGIVSAPDRDFCAAVLINDHRTPVAYAAVDILTEEVKRRVAFPRRLMGPGLCFARPDGSYTYYPNEQTRG